MLRFNSFLCIILVSFLFVSCEEKIDIKLDSGTSQLTVDAWITNNPGSQVIKLSKTADYFDNSTIPPALGAEVKLHDDSGNVFTFIDISNDGSYIWTPGPGDTLARVGRTYTLDVLYGGEHYTSQTTMQPSVTIDSLTQYKEPDGLSTDSVIRAQFWARDNFGRQDFYWIRTYRNGTFNNKPSGILTAQEAAFGSGDGFIFIVPYRQGINEFDNPFQVGDLVKVEIYGINENSYTFLNQAQSQMINGGLFATPPFNVITNIKNADPNATETSRKPVGWFEVCASSFIQKYIQ
jgi:Domain of unknown function (DUF4249)